MLVKHANSISKSYWESEKLFHCTYQVLNIENIWKSLVLKDGTFFYDKNKVKIYLINLNYKRC